ncbi:MAG: HAMP domain-containing sensor histidine kinase, partial [Candidatus Gracilibacteria bacterium]|nr:HAMP domain-containing sensor histidine kinase [Candidatus Gracilibacteria bacterium]
MSLAKKFIIVVLSSILFIAITNIVGFYVFYSSYLKVFLAEKLEIKSEVTLDYINEIVLKSKVDKQANEIDSLFNDASINFFEKLGDNNLIKLDKKENVDIVVNYLIKSGVAPKYIEEVVPTNNFAKVIGAFEEKDSPEYRFLTNLFISQILLNILAIGIVGMIIFLFIQKTLVPIKRATKQISSLKPGKRAEKIIYNSKDEIGLLVNSINSLNEKIIIQETIRNKLLADISHELKTPITSIQCYLEGIIDGVIKLDEKNLESITNEMKRLISLVNKIMEFEKFENKSLDLNLEDKNLYNILKFVVETHKKSLKEKHQKIKITGDYDLEKKVDKNSFIQLSHNLIGNFLKYSGKHSKMNINITKNYIDFID